MSYLTVHKIQIVFLDIATEQTPFHPSGCIIKGKKLKMTASTKNTYMKMDFFSYYFSSEILINSGYLKHTLYFWNVRTEMRRAPSGSPHFNKRFVPDFRLREEETEVRPHGSLQLPPKGSGGADAELCSLGTAT